jgi:aquaporin Z
MRGSEQASGLKTDPSTKDLHHIFSGRHPMTSAPRKMTSASSKKSHRPARAAAQAVRAHWDLYLFEAAELAIFMISACSATVLLFHPGYAAVRMIPSAAMRRLLMGLAMGGTAVLIIHSPMGKRSGAHFNPAITLSYLRLRKIAVVDAIFYILFQFLGGIAGVGICALFLGKALAAPQVNYAVTVPGLDGTGAAFVAELFMATLLMAVVLWFSNRPALASWTSYLVGILIASYVFFFAPISGFSINPARTVGSAVFAQVWTAVWAYFAAPLLGMLGSAEIYLRLFGADKILCAKLHPDPDYPCPFRCHFPLHHPMAPPQNLAGRQT